MILKQIAVFLENRPGTINDACRLLSESGINIYTLSLAETESYGILRLIIKDWQKAKDVLEKNSFAVKVTDVVAIEVDNRPGGMTEVLEALSSHGINVEYMYAFASGLDGRAVLIFRFDDPQAVIKELKEDKHLRVIGENELFKA